MKKLLIIPIAVSLGALAGCKEAPVDKTEVVDVRMPDGTVVRGAPEGITQSELLRRLEDGSYDADAMLVPGANGGSGYSYSEYGHALQDDERNPYRGDAQLHYGTSRYGDPTQRFRGEIDESGYIRLRNLNGDTLRGYVESDGSVRLRSFEGETYRGQIETDGSMRLRDYDGSTLSGQVDGDF